MSTCPTVELLRQFLDEQCGAADQTAVNAHLETCPHCQERLEQLTSGFSSLRDVYGDTSRLPDGERPDGSPPAAAELTTNFVTCPPAGPDPPPQAASEPADPGAAPPEVPGYELLALLGRGGMGVVYKARQRALDRLVAVKMIRAASADEDEYRARFQAEAEAIARLRHPNIVQIYEVGESAGRPFLAIELLEGGSLEGRLKDGPFPARPAAELLATLARATHAAHLAGVVHRDLKPANVLFSADGIPKVADFGLAKRLEEPAVRQTQTGQIVGSPHYMAPEQAAGGGCEVGTAADVYALGVVLYELLTGHVPFHGTTVLETLQLVVGAEPVPPQQVQPAVPRDLDTICLKCLQKDPARRYGSAADLADDLDRFLSHRPVLARPTPWWERAGKWARRRPASALGLATAAVLVVAAAAAGAWLHFSALEWERRDLHELADKRGRAQGELLVAQQALARRDWHGARGTASALLARIEGEPRLRELTDLAGRVRDEADEALAAAERAAAERGRYAKFLSLRDEALFRDAGFTGLDAEPNRALIRGAADEALRLFGDDEPASLTAEERSRLREGRYELLLILAAAVDRVDDAAPLLEDAARLRPPTKAFHLSRAAYLARRHDDDGADRARAEADRVEPSSASDHFLTALERYRAVDAAGLAGAIEHFRTALDRQPDHFWAQYLLAVCHLRAAPPRFGEAIANLTGCLARRPDDFAWGYLLRGYARGESAKGPDEFKAADEDYRRAGELLAHRPDDEAGYVLLVNRGVLHRQQQPDAAAEDLRAAIRLKPRQYTAYANLAQVYAAQQRWPEAKAQLDRAIALRDDLAVLYRQRAKLALQQKEYGPALADFEEAIRRERPGSPALAQDHADRGRLLLHDRRHAEALAAADEALRLAPDLTRAHALRVATLLELERYDDLLRACDGYLRLAGPTAPKEDRADLYRVRALARARRGDYPGAVADYHHALELAPGSAALHAGRGWVYLLSDAPRLALADFEEAVRLQPDGADAHNGRGLARVKVGRLAEGTADAEAAVRLEPEDPRTAYNAVRIYAQAALLAATRADGPDPFQTRAYEARAWELLGRALARQPEEKRAAFWRETVEKDEALFPLRGKREFATLAARYAAPLR